MGTVRLDAGALVFSEGERGDRAYLIRSGLVEILAERGGQPVVLARLGPGELFGEMAVIDDQPRSATARALEPLELLVVTREMLHSHIEAGDPVLGQLLRVLIGRMRHAQNALVERIGTADGTDLTASGPAPEPAGEPGAFDFLIHEVELRRALEAGEFEPFFQPIVRLDTGALAGFEALVRWRHPRRGIVPPAEFLEAAERCGVIHALDLRMFESAARALLAAAGGGADGPFLSINLSGSHFASDAIVGRLRAILDDTRFPAHRLKVEITEGVLVARPDQALGIIEGIHGLGAQVSLDDFGTGYSSLSYLHRFPIDVLKIDRSFIVGMGENARTAAIVEAVARLARGLGLRVVAEGVETEAMLAPLQALGCHYGQGWHFGRPMPADAMRRVVGAGRVLTGVPPL
ncbi:EAL domain-containing protein [Azospirillum sp. SYSU D00513]|uniref:EAL domain-containing protein n=1 Tax=Azospirillum sp. SYSU D00513 TaxID=2812561 RepID=UPI001A969D9A|nr:EAL domain-containing protein [Azospirillum sp. SYSU D00513]